MYFLYVVFQTEISPLQIAVDSMKNSTRSLTQSVEDCEEFGEKYANALAAKLQGIIKPAVQGGIANYEKVINFMLQLFDFRHIYFLSTVFEKKHCSVIFFRKL